MLKQHSMIRKITVQMTVILTILLATLILSNFYSLEVVRKNQIASSKNTLAIFINSIQNSLNNTSRDLLEVFDTQINSFSTFGTKDESQKYFEAIRLQEILASKVSNTSGSDGLFISVPNEDFLLASFSNRMYSKEGLFLTDFLKAYDFDAKNVTGGAEWMPVEVNGVAYLLKSITYSNVIFGAVIKTDTLMSAIKKNANEQNLFYLTDKSDRMLSTTNPVDLSKEKQNLTFTSKHFFVTEQIPEFGRLTNVVASRNVFYGLEWMQWLIIFLSMLAVVITSIIFRFFAKDLIQPILELVKGAKEVEKGNWDYPFSNKASSIEFARLSNSFSSMVREIKTLKINTYEEKLERNKTELKYLQMQIRPHFFLNAITTISSLTYHNKNEEIRLIISHLSEHLRYMFRGGLVQVQIQEEMKHVENYIQMQEMRYPNQIFYMADIDRELQAFPLPQYLIQTFVENTFKHALAHKEMLSIFIKVDSVLTNGQPFLRVVIEDNGEGFPEEMMEEVNFSDLQQSETGEKVGIRNIQRTLKLLYKRDRLLTLSNIQPSGAKVEIVIPMEDAG